MPYLTHCTCGSSAEKLYFHKFDMAYRPYIYIYIYIYIYRTASVIFHLLSSPILLFTRIAIPKLCFYRYVRIYIRYTQKWQKTLSLVWKWWKTKLFDYERNFVTYYFYTLTHNINTIFVLKRLLRLFSFPWNKGIGLGFHLFTIHVVLWGNVLGVEVHEWYTQYLLGA